MSTIGRIAVAGFVLPLIPLRLAGIAATRIAERANELALSNAASEVAGHDRDAMMLRAELRGLAARAASSRPSFARSAAR